MLDLKRFGLLFAVVSLPRLLGVAALAVVGWSVVSAVQLVRHD